jgi:hypothetical protein
MSEVHSASTDAATGTKAGAKLSGKGTNRPEFHPGPPPAPQPNPGQGAPPGGAPQPLPAVQQAGQFAIVTSGNYFVTAVGGGNETTDVLRTSVTKPSTEEKFTLWYVPSTGEYGIQTVGGQFLFATNGGDLASLFPFGNQEVDTIQSTATQIIDYERFTLLPNVVDNFPTGWFGILTVRGFYLIAANGGGLTVPPVLLTNGTAATLFANPPQLFGLVKSGDAGSGYKFGLVVAGGPATVQSTTNPLPIGAWVLVTEGGGVDSSSKTPALTIGPNEAGNGELEDEQQIPLSLILQSDGTYAFLTASGNYVTADDGGFEGSFSTDASEVANWQKFTLTPNNDCTYYIQAYNGYYLGIGGVGPTTTSDNTQAVKWRLQVCALAPTT